MLFKRDFSRRVSPWVFYRNFKCHIGNIYLFYFFQTNFIYKNAKKMDKLYHYHNNFNDTYITFICSYSYLHKFGHNLCTLDRLLIILFDGSPIRKAIMISIIFCNFYCLWYAYKIYCCSILNITYSTSSPTGLERYLGMVISLILILLWFILSRYL